MFPTSSQKKNWMFKDEGELQTLRAAANRNYIETYQDKLEPAAKQAMLNMEEERTLLKFYELQMRDLCRRFQPPMPRAVIGTAFHYFKRFYVNNSVMDYHPKEILVTCVYLASKVEEFNVSIVQFVANIKGDREKAADIIINNELLLMQQLNYHLTVHNPFRPVEGFLIDIKVRSQLDNPEKLRGGIDELLDNLYLTDACLLYSPSQIALAAILHSVSKNKENLDAYVTQTLLGGDASRLTDLIEAVRNIRVLYKITEPPSREYVKSLEKRLELCRNEENNPDSQVYKERMHGLLDDEDERASRRYSKATRKSQGQSDSKLLGVNTIPSEEKH
ncbi:cyclin-H [Cimex lectularius]|uniref:Cyclin-H n=1 Tax=Cimex lectularius TaxID=79782 RepID=A0A8I6RJ65_CIMLE|nr:cyclin-H [Cimex lectularius]